MSYKSNRFPFVTHRVSHQIVPREHDSPSTGPGRGTCGRGLGLRLGQGAAATRGTGSTKLPGPAAPFLAPSQGHPGSLGPGEHFCRCWPGVSMWPGQRSQRPLCFHSPFSVQSLVPLHPQQEYTNTYNNTFFFSFSSEKI